MSHSLNFKSYDQKDLNPGDIVYTIFIHNTLKRYFLRQYKVIQLTDSQGDIVIESTQDHIRSLAKANKVHTDPRALVAEWISMLEKDKAEINQRIKELSESIGIYLDQGISI